MSEWQECRLGEVAEVQTGPFGSQLHQSDYKAVGTPIVTVEHLGDNRIVHSNLPLVGDLDKERLIKYTLKEGDVVFSRVGSVDRCAYVHKEEDGWMFSGRLLRVRAQDDAVDSRFLSFYFSQESFKDTIRMIAVGATMPSINTEILSNVGIILPKLPEQRAIADVLSSLDDKMDLLHRQNKTLEGMAEALWRKMFVEEVDPGWKKRSLRDYLQIQGGYAFKGSDFKETGEVGIIKITNISAGLVDINKTQFVKRQIVEPLDNKFKVTTGSILIAMTGAEIGKIGIVEKTGKELWLNQRVGMFREVRKYGNLLGFFALNSDEGQEHVLSSATGSAQPNISSTGIEDFGMPVVPDSVLNVFGLAVRPLFGKICFNLSQIHTLSRLRDTLLPKLMSGEVRVKL
jgi:type I restriction enzyme S subunit